MSLRGLLLLDFCLLLCKLLLDAYDLSVQNVLQVVHWVLRVVRVLIVERIARVYWQLDHDLAAWVALVQDVVAHCFESWGCYLVWVRTCSLGLRIWAFRSLTTCLVVHLGIFILHKSENLLFLKISYRIEGFGLDALVCSHSEEGIELE